MNVYRFRAECPADSERLIELLPPGELIRFHAVSRDVDQCAEIALASLTLDDLRRVMRRVPDGHVMRQTVQPVELFTGERDWSD